MLDLASATRIHNRPEMSHQPLDGHDLLPHLEEGRSSPAKQPSGDRLFMRRPWKAARAITPPRPGEDGSSKSMLLGYARVSTVDQNLALQRDALAEAGCRGDA